MPSEFTSCAALVIGGSSGIGRACAEVLAEQGAGVAVVGSDAGAAEAVAHEIEDLGGRAIGLTADVRVLEQVEHAVDETVAAFGAIDVLVCSAGIQRYGTATSTDPVVWDEVFDVNVRGAFYAARCALPHLRRSDRPSIVLVSSIQALSTQAGVTAYAASKGALNALARSMAVDEAPHGVRVNAVLPGSVDTPMLRASAALFSDATPEDVERTLDSWGRSHLLGRVAQPREVAEVVAFLASERASFITGECVRVDGGLTVRLGAALPDAALDTYPARGA